MCVCVFGEHTNAHARPSRSRRGRERVDVHYNSVCILAHMRTVYYTSTAGAPSRATALQPRYMAMHPVWVSARSCAAWASVSVRVEQGGSRSRERVCDWKTRYVIRVKLDYRRTHTTHMCVDVRRRRFIAVPCDVRFICIRRAIRDIPSRVYSF